MQEDFQLTINGLSYRAAGTPLKMSLADFLKNESIELSDGLVREGHAGLLFFLIDFNASAGPVHRLIKASRTSLISMAERELVAIDPRVEDPNESSLWVKLKAVNDSSEDDKISLSRTISAGLEGLDDGQGYSLFSDHLCSVLRRNESGVKVSTKHLLTVPSSYQRLKKLNYKSSDGELYYRPGTVLEAIRLRVLRQCSSFSGSELFEEDPSSGPRNAVHISLDSVEELREIIFDDGHWEIGTGVTLRSFAERLRAEFSLIDDFCKRFTDTHFVNRFTVLEEFGSAGPGSGILTVLLSLGAGTIIDGLDERRTMSLEELLYEETLSGVGEQELITAVTVPGKGDLKTLTSYYQVMEGPYGKAPIIRASFLVEIDSKNRVSGSRIWFDTGSGLPIRFDSAEKLIKGRSWTRELQQQVSAVTSSGDGIAGSLGLGSDFQRVLIQNLLLKFINENLGESDHGPGSHEFIDLESELTVRGKE
jgi:carbon-monoxide dehydrogenase medium subunit